MRYKDRVRFLLVYIKEAHAAGQWESSINEREGVAMGPAKTLAEKEAHAVLCTRKLKLPFAHVTDGMEGQMEAAYQAWPSRVYVVGRDGRVVFQSGLGEQDFRAEALEGAIRTASAF